MKTIFKAVLIALALTGGTAAAQAHTVWRFPHKSTPYAVPHTHPGGYAVRNTTECPRTVIRRSFRSKVTLVCLDR